MNVIDKQQCNSAIPRTTPTERFDLHDNGTATDRRTGLTWRRCAEGQTWKDGRCVGDAASFSWDEATRRFGQPDPVGWRLPELKELASIVELACSYPAINLTAFPDTPSTWFWSASPFASNSARAWAQVFDYGGGTCRDRNNPGQVRLVRAGQ
jgi:hypothetical protein